MLVSATGPTVDQDEVARFAALAQKWWDTKGEFAPLHALNPIRLAFIRDRLCARHGRDPDAQQPLEGLRLIDVGCGGGLLAEPLARMGAEMVAIDAAAENIGTARAHAEQNGVAVDYRCVTAEALAEAGERFDGVVAMEIIEHVADVDAFMAALSDLARPGAPVFMATLNRTLKARALAVFLAERVLRWLPPGTHDWRKFLKPHELARAMRHAGLNARALVGVVYNPIGNSWRVSRDTDINYMMMAEKPLE
jgi:2-polyprenyl-6-hydroxyphenyl methylase/3-demethylubiquinone-9 3-methyltransferase